jgi:fucose 4-O-acetylase-like acetyltransferase
MTEKRKDMPPSSGKPGFNQEMHLLRAIGIVLVVLGHAVDPFVWTPVFKIVKDLIYAFHMPLFFFISGFFGVKYFLPGGKPLLPIVTGQFKRLMVVYFFCSALVIPLKLMLNHFADRPMVAGNVLSDLFFYPDHHPMIILWFVYVLFVMQILFLGVNSLFKINYRRTIPAVAIFAILLTGHLTSGKFPRLFNLNLLTYFAVYFYLGFLANLHYERLKSFFIQYRYAAMVLPASFLFFNYTKTLFAASFLYAMIGILITWFVSMNLATRRSFFKSSLNRIGNYAYDIYLYHYFFMAGLILILIKIPENQSLLPFAPIFVLSLGCPIILSKYVLRKNGLLRRLALGN